jgi:hypothetical protein
MPSVLVEFFIPDDTYYYLTIARNVASGAGFTFDRLHATNGFQFLWQMMLVPVAALVGGTLDGPLTAIAVLQGALVSTGAWFSVKGLRAMGVSPRAMAIGLAVTLGNPLVFKMLFSGMEAALGFCVLSAYATVLLRIIRTETVGIRDALAGGLIASLLVLARLDYAVLLVALGLVLWRRRSRDGLRPTAVVVCLVAVALAGYLTWNAVTFDTALPVSGLAKSWYLSEQMIWDRVFGGLMNLLRLPLVIGGQVWSVVSSRPTLAAGAVAVAAASVMVVRAAFAFDRRSLDRIRLLGNYALAVLAHVLYLFIYMGRFAITFWYYVPEVVLVIFALTVVIDSVRARGGAGRATTAAIAAMVAVALVYGAMYLLYTFDSSRKTRFVAARETGLWMSQHLDPDARIGSWNAGALSYFSRRQVINLDGLVNDVGFVREYLSQGRVVEYVADQDITYLADYVRGLDQFADYGELRVLYEAVHGTSNFSLFEDKPAALDERFVVVELVR